FCFQLKTITLHICFFIWKIPFCVLFCISVMDYSGTNNKTKRIRNNHRITVPLISYLLSKHHNAEETKLTDGFFFQCSP
uniref:Uncharacterized protein n=1 Tax=Poecilia mexicana TaxID=48701 RepID=A0A3B3WIA9_9TELE